MINQDVLQAQSNKDAMNAFIASNRDYILKVTGHILHKHIDIANDDAYPIAMFGFYEAVKNYDESKGSFHTFAYIVMRNRLFDYGRMLKKIVSHEDMTVDVDFSFDVTSKSINEYAKLTKKEELQLEIVALSNRLKFFDINYSSLLNVSPKAKKTQRSIIQLFKAEAACREAYETLIRTHRLQIKAFEVIPTFNRKMIERHRAFIIAKLIIYFEDFPMIKSFIDWS